MLPLEQRGVDCVLNFVCTLCCNYLIFINEGVTSFDCDNTIFDDSDIYECDSGECILRGFRCDGDPDCADGSDEGASNCGQ